MGAPSGPSETFSDSVPRKHFFKPVFFIILAAPCTSYYPVLTSDYGFRFLFRSSSLRSLFIMFKMIFAVSNAFHYYIYCVFYSMCAILTKEVVYMFIFMKILPVTPMSNKQLGNVIVLFSILSIYSLIKFGNHTFYALFINAIRKCLPA